MGCGCCNGCGARDDKKKVTDDVTGIRRPVEAPDTARMNRTADLEVEEIVRTAGEEEHGRQPKRV